MPSTAGDCGPQTPVAISIVVPVFNECDSLPILHAKIRAVMDSIGQAWEIIYVDDGSTDGSKAALRALQAGDDHVVLAIQRRNFGKSLALDTGFALARGAIVVTLDADLQDEPDEIPRLLAALDNGYDMVSGSAAPGPPLENDSLAHREQHHGPPYRTAHARYEQRVQSVPPRSR